MTKHVNIGIKEDVHARAKIISILKNVSLGTYLQECIETAIQKDRKLLEDIKVGKLLERKDG